MGSRAWAVGLLLAVGLGGVGLAWWMRRPARARDHQGAQPGDAAPVPAPAPAADADHPELATLYACDGPLTGARFSLGAAPVTLGTAAECTVVLPASGTDVERQHARIWRRDGHFMIHRLARYGDVLVDGQPIQWAILESGDRIDIGPHAFNVAVNVAVGADA